MKRYTQVERKPLTDPDFDDDGEPSQTKAWLEYTWRKLNAVLWISAAFAIGYVIKLPDVIMIGHVPGRPDKQLNRCHCRSLGLGRTAAHPVPHVCVRFFFNIALAGFCGWLSVAAYLIIWLKCVLPTPCLAALPQPL